MNVYVGFGRADITPSESVPLAGLGNTLNRMSETVLDPLLTTCLAFTDEQGSTALIFNSDLIRAVPALVSMARQRITDKYGISAERIMFSNTHTHSATDYLHWDRHPAVLKAADLWIDRVTEAAGLALEDKKPAKFFVGSSHPQGLNFVRHYTRNSQTNELIGHPYEPDNQLQLVKIAREGGRDILIMNWQAHPCFTSGYDKHDISADYIHSIREAVERETGALFAFFLGASGDVNTRSRIKEEVIAPTREIYTEKMIVYLLQAVENMHSVSTGPVCAAEKVITLENDHSDDHRVDDARNVVDFWKRTYDRKATDAMAKPYGINSPYHANAIIGRSGLEATQDMTISAVTVGDVGFAFAPYEMFCKNGMYIKENSPLEATVVATCANAGFSYLADDFAFTEQCYEVDVRKFVRGTAEKVAAGFVELLTQLKGGK